MQESLSNNLNNQYYQPRSSRQSTKLVLNARLEAWLATVLYRRSWIYIDRWSFVHVFTGMCFGFIFAFVWPSVHAWWIVFIILVAYELLEKMLEGKLFRAEEPIDTLWDVIIGMIGFAVTFLLLTF